MRAVIDRVALMFVAALALLGAAGPAIAYDDRVALVIGNDAYPTEPLKNAVNDARNVQKVLQELGFKVVYRQNTDLNGMRSAAVDFTRVLEGARAAVFYYAGHGIQYRDKNYLIPIDAKLSSEAEIAFYSLEVNQILDAMDDAKVQHKFIILDACRNNPFRNIFTQSGLAKISKVPPGTLIAYAAQAGAVASDGDGENGLYTKHLLREMKNPGIQSTLVFNNVSSAVGEESGRKQIPEFVSVPFPGGKPFFFAERGAVTTVAAGTGQSTVSGDTAAQLDKEFWGSVKDSKRIDDYQAYLEQFPSGVYARLARNRIDDLRREKSLQQVAAAPLAANPSGSAPVLVAEKAPVSQPAAPSATGAAPAAPSQAAATAPVRLAAAPATNDVRGIEAKPAAQPVAVAASQPPATPAQASSPAAAGSAAASATLPAAIAPAAAVPAAASAPTLVASVSPEAKSALPPVPAVPRVLTGTIEFRDGSRYTGEYKEDKDKRQIMHGKGEFVSGAFRYTGEFKENRKDGRGAYQWSSGDKFDGDFVDDEPNGRGIWDFANGDRYEGEVVKGKINGKGTLTNKNGDRYTGTFQNGLQHGKGIYQFANGDKYEGGMNQGRMSGEGVYVSKNGDRREATFVDGVAQGKGVYLFSNGDRYEGEFQSGALTGKGKYFYSNGLRTEGNYVNGALKGEGMFIFNDGSWFEGVFEEGGQRAKGVAMSKDGTRRPAIIVNGRVEALPEGQK
ncbi:MAG TPA: caspase family protein [Usitatibacteraceae bacterium]|nr:caspase family protein [Usitatibacteraceae bacterium]